MPDLGTLTATGMVTVKEDHWAEFATHGGGEGTEDLVLTIASGCEFLS